MTRARTEQAKSSGKVSLAMLLAAAVLAGCGGGGEDITSSGVYQGTSADGREVTAVVLDDGKYWMLYSAAGTTGNLVGGVEGNAFTYFEPTFTSTDARSYSLEGSGTQPATVAGTLQRGASFDGTVNVAVGTPLSFATRYAPDSREDASLEKLAGSYPGQVSFALGVRPAVFTVTADGAVSSSINNCSIGGTVAPRTDVNAYDLTIVFGGAPCVFPNASFSGIARYDAATGRLSAMVRNAAVLQPIFYSGTRS